MALVWILNLEKRLFGKLSKRCILKIFVSCEKMGSECKFWSKRVAFLKREKRKSCLWDKAGRRKRHSERAARKVPQSTGAAVDAGIGIDWWASSSTSHGPPCAAAPALVPELAVPAQTLRLLWSSQHIADTVRASTELISSRNCQHHVRMRQPPPTAATIGERGWLTQSKAQSFRQRHRSCSHQALRRSHGQMRQNQFSGIPPSKSCRDLLHRIYLWMQSEYCGKWTSKSTPIRAEPNDPQVGEIFAEK